MNVNEMINREEKASKMAAVLFKAGITVEELANATQEEWGQIAASADCRPPNSQTTKDRVAALLYELYADAADRADQKSDQQWEESQEYGANRCPPRE